MKRRKTARETDAEFRMYEFNPTKCFTCSQAIIPDLDERGNPNRWKIDYSYGYPICGKCKTFLDDNKKVFKKAFRL